jgi:hypothetical protein
MVADKAKRDRKAAIQNHNDKTHVWSPNFQVEDYVLAAEHRKSGMSKLQVKWKGMRRVASVESDYVLFCRPDQCSLTNSYVDNNSSLISE